MTSLFSQKRKGHAGWVLPQQGICRESPQLPATPQTDKRTSSSLSGLLVQRPALLGAKADCCLEPTRDWLDSRKGTSCSGSLPACTAASDTWLCVEPHALLEAEDPGRVGKRSSIPQRNS